MRGAFVEDLDLVHAYVLAARKHIPVTNPEVHRLGRELQCRGHCNHEHHFLLRLKRSRPPTSPTAVKGSGTGWKAKLFGRMRPPPFAKTPRSAPVVASNFSMYPPL